MSDEWGNEGPQRAYVSRCGCVHFYPSRCWRICRANGDDPHWHDDRDAPEGECASMFTFERDFDGKPPLPEAVALAIWGLRELEAQQ